MNIDDMFAPSEAALLFGAVLLSALIICLVFQGVEKAHDAITRFWWRRWGSDRMFAHMDAEYESWKASWLGHAQELADHLRIPQDPNEYQLRALREFVRKRGAEWRREHPDRSDLPGTMITCLSTRPLPVGGRRPARRW